MIYNGTKRATVYVKVSRIIFIYIHTYIYIYIRIKYIIKGLYYTQLFRYSNVDDHSPISWPIPIGKTPTTFAIRVSIKGIVRQTLREKIKKIVLRSRCPMIFGRGLRKWDSVI